MKSLSAIVIKVSLMVVAIGALQWLGRDAFYDFNKLKSNDLNVQFIQRLDEVTGEYKPGRLTASVNSKVNTSLKENNYQGIISESFNGGGVQLAESGVQQAAQEAVQEEIIEVPAPAILENLELELTGGLYQQTPLEVGKNAHGYARYQNGVVEEISVELPEGKKLEIHGFSEMAGNVFQFEDSETRELRSAVFYKVGEGHYMVTLTEETNFKGLRLEFKVITSEDTVDKSEFVEVKNRSWGMNEQNDENYSADNNMQDVISNPQIEDEDQANSVQSNFSYQF